SANETSAVCQWQIPESHFLESWSDTRAFDGTASIIQPLIQPLHDSLTGSELLAELLADPAKPWADRPVAQSSATSSGYELVRRTWQHHFAAHPPEEPTDFEAFWERSLRLGIVEATRSEPVTPRLRPDFAEALREALREPSRGDSTPRPS